MRKTFCDRCKEETNQAKKITVFGGDEYTGQPGPGCGFLRNEFCPECHKQVWKAIHEAMTW